jgi:hypothetical protein
VSAWVAGSGAFANIERDDRYEVEERAAILEFDAGATRGRATATAVSAYDARNRRKVWDE